MKLFSTCAAVIAATALTSPAVAQSSDPSLSVTTGVDYSSGDYGTGIDTEIIVVPFTARYKTGDLRFSAALPWLRIDGASSIVGGGDGGPVVIDPNAPRTTRSGLGDVTLGVNWALPEERLGFGLDFGARVKLPTASESKGLGTGKADASLSAELSKSFGNVTPFVSAGYRFVGKPEGLDLNDAWFGSAGASVVAGRRSVLLASYDYRQARSPLIKDSQELFGAFSTPLSSSLNFTLYGSKGLSDGAADYGVGAMITLKAF